MINEITIEGNRHTKDFVIQREILFKEKDQIQWNQIDKMIEMNILRLESLGIFNDATIEFQRIDSTRCKVDITVVENWYIYPNPIFELSDRNFSEWWINNNRSLSRVNYGARLEHINLTGRRDKATLTIQGGYTKKYELKYRQPHLTQNGKYGTEAFIYFANQKELPYKTENNKSLYGSYDDRIVLSRFRTGAALFYRPDVFTGHSFRLEYHNNFVHEHVIQELNKDYFLNGRTGIKFFYFSYMFDYNQIVYPFYPKGGYQIQTELKKEGFGIFNHYNNLSLSLKGTYYKKLGQKWFIGSIAKVKANLIRSKVAFANNSALGYGDDSLVGYTVNVIDGTDFFYIKNSLRRQWFQRRINLGKWMPLRHFKIMDVELYSRLDFDTGYVNDRFYAETNTFNNRMIYGFGAGFDLLLYNNYRASIRYEYNDQFQGFFIFDYKVAF